MGTQKETEQKRTRIVQEVWKKMSTEKHVRQLLEKCDCDLFEGILLHPELRTEFILRCHREDFWTNKPSMQHLEFLCLRTLWQSHEEQILTLT
jgi:hypothetical protein